jgi:hypothetical protein
LSACCDVAWAGVHHALMATTRDQFCESKR